MATHGLLANCACEGLDMGTEHSVERLFLVGDGCFDRCADLVLERMLLRLADDRRTFGEHGAVELVHVHDFAFFIAVSFTVAIFFCKIMGTVKVLGVVFVRPFLSTNQHVGIFF